MCYVKENRHKIQQLDDLRKETVSNYQKFFTFFYLFNYLTHLINYKFV